MVVQADSTTLRFPVINQLKISWCFFSFRASSDSSVMLLVWQKITTTFSFQLKKGRFGFPLRDSSTVIHELTYWHKVEYTLIFCYESVKRWTFLRIWCSHFFSETCCFFQGNSPKTKNQPRLVFTSSPWWNTAMAKYCRSGQNHLQKGCGKKKKLLPRNLT